MTKASNRRRQRRNCPERIAITLAHNHTQHTLARAHTCDSVIIFVCRASSVDMRLRPISSDTRRVGVVVVDAEVDAVPVAAALVVVHTLRIPMVVRTLVSVAPVADAWRVVESVAARAVGGRGAVACGRALCACAHHRTSSRTHNSHRTHFGDFAFSPTPPSMPRGPRDARRGLPLRVSSPPSCSLSLSPVSFPTRMSSISNKALLVCMHIPLRASSPLSCLALLSLSSSSVCRRVVRLVGVPLLPPDTDWKRDSHTHAHNTPPHLWWRQRCIIITAVTVVVFTHASI
jgi:hypothetical protein